MPERDEGRAALYEQVGAVYAYFARRTTSEADARHLFRQTMTHAWRRIDRFPTCGVRRQRMWALSVAAGVLSQHAAELDEELELGSLGDEVDSVDLARWGCQKPTVPRMTLRDAIRRLAFSQRELVTLVAWEGLSLLEAGEVMGMDRGVALAGYSAARANLRAVLEGARI